MFTIRLTKFGNLNRVHLRALSGRRNDVTPVFQNAPKFQNRTAVCDKTGRYTFGNIYLQATELALELSNPLQGKTGERVLFLCPNDASYVITLWAIWMSGQIAVPLSPLHPEALLQYYINDTNSSLIISAPEFRGNMEPLSKRAQVKLHILDDALLTNAKAKNHRAAMEGFPRHDDAMILYTSGTTGSPKGVVLTHKNIATQVNVLTKAWKWSCDDVILHTLPLHHVHGTVNALFCPLFIGATTVMAPKFKAPEVWSFLLNKNELIKEKITVFMAVPTMYSKLIEEYEANPKGEVGGFLSQNVRLMVSGSAPLPAPLYQRWLDISGHKLLERYGMTEIGMCLSNVYDSDREPGFVGLPLPSVTIAIADPETGDILLKCHNNGDQMIVEDLKNSQGDVIGELFVKGDSVFKEYYNKPLDTSKEFTKDGWFKTGDISQYVRAKNKIKMLGRKSADIIKSGGYKISALQIETILLGHPAIKECAVVGVADEVYGEIVAAVLVLHDELSLEELKAWALERMPKYWVPTVLKRVPDIPKNAMGKVNKKELKSLLF